MRQWNKETINEQLKLHKKQNKDERYNYFSREFNSLWYCWELEKYTISLQTQLQQKDNIIKEVREYITSYESIETIQQFDHNKNNEDLDYSTIDEMTRRYMMVHDKILKILDK